MRKLVNNIDIYFMLLIINFMILISYVFNFRDKLGIEDFVIIGTIIVNIIISYNFGIKKGLISSIIFIFLYSTYIFIESFVQEINVFRAYFFIGTITFSSVVAGILSEKINKIAKEVNFYQKEYEKIVTIDSQTGLNNIKGFYKDLEREIARSKRHKTSMVLMYIKFKYLDELKSILNDREFNNIIKMVSRVIDNSVRLEDITYKFENDEFAILMLDSELKGSEVVKDRILSNIKTDKFKLDNGKYLNLEIKIGLKSFDENIEDALMFKKLAEREVQYDI